ncbi:Holliday junction resolvase RuvX [candidate division TA06 bacterium]|uniref:Putative pre-16S rRNA nuclease n=1 Tax=candidate division TA06 bacterium TaxID=2250710 RepID=A0A933I927_UNCT6|nr:Holliday junction resolvase RuvX [candidate division TA06 bacterium]
MPESKPNGRILALDLGRRRVGSAVSDELGITAQGLECFEIRGRQGLLARIKEYQQRFPITAIVLGKPSHLDGSPTGLSRMVEETKIFLERRLQLPVHLYDERFTSKIAQQSLHQSGIKLKNNKCLLDKTAATIILTDYLKDHAAS